MSDNTHLPSRQTRWQSIAQLGLSLLALSFLWTQAISTLTLALMSSSVQDVVGNIPTHALLAIAFASFVLGLMTLASAVYAFRRLSGREGTLPGAAFRTRIQQNALWLAPLLFILAFLGGWWALGRPVGKMLLFPPLHFLAASMPVWWWFSLGARRLGVQTNPPRRWGLITTGISLGPLFSILGEILIILAGAIVLMVYVGQNEQAANTLSAIGRRLAFSAGNPHAMRRVMQNLLSTYPWIGLVGLSFIAIFVPLIEEIGKSLGLWAFLGRGITPQEGFWAGMISGGMFALFESSYNVGTTRVQWSMTILGRVGTSLMHITASGLLGAALADAWRNKRRYLHLGATYLLVVGLHGLWNAGVIGLTFNNLVTNRSLPVIVASSTAVGAVLAFFLGTLLRQSPESPQNTGAKTAPESLVSSQQNGENP